MEKIIIVEDDKIIREELQSFLGRYGYEVVVPRELENIVEFILKENSDLVLLDINLPIYDGYYICREIRKKSEVPIIIVTSRDSDMDELMSMNLGADDFVTKPYNTQILLARIAALLKRSNNKTTSNNILNYKNLQLNLSNAKITCNNKEAELTKNEVKILSYLMNWPAKGDSALSSIYIPFALCCQGFCIRKGIFQNIFRENPPTNLSVK